ncbi:MAG: glycosyltransferase [Proteobacteria bacterium]|nr:glycosyltransferase [Pseudomonadota bacterium]
MAHKISIIIFCRGKEKDLGEYLSDFTGFADEFIVAQPDCGETDPFLLQHMGVPVVFPSKDADFRRSLAAAVKNARCEWILMLRPGERISVNHKKKLPALCDNPGASAYYMSTEKRAAGNVFETYEWMGNPGKYSTPAVIENGYLPCLEVRLFRKNRFLSFPAAAGDSFQPVLDLDTASIPISGVRITCPRKNESPGKTLTAVEQAQQDLKRFQGVCVENIDINEKFSFLDRDAIGFSMVDRKDLPSLVSALEKGLGHIDLLKFMVHNLIKNGDYEDAIELADTISEKMGDHMELWRLKGTAHFYMLHLEKAAQCFDRALLFDAGDTSILLNLAKISIVSNRFDQAGQFLNKAIALGNATPEMEFILSLIKKNEGRTATLSLLMLCRDEEQYVGRALDSVKDIVDEIVLVDTGSQDGTVGIALEYGATVVRSGWEDDFGKARNEGLGYVTGDYVFCLDADEFLEIDARMSLLVFKHILPVKEKIGITLDVHSLTEENLKNHHLPPLSVERRTAIFPKLSGVFFKGRVFERIDDSLDRLGIHRIIANNTHISHQSDNTDLRKARKADALQKSFAEPLSLPMIFEGINYWIDRGNAEHGLAWLGRGIREANGNKQYTEIICRLIRHFDQQGGIDVHSRLFDELLIRHAHSYPLMTLCADLLCEAGEYKRATDILGKLTDRNDSCRDDSTEKKDVQLNLLNFAMVNLETGNLGRCIQALNRLAADDEMTDAVQSVLFYYNLKTKEIDQAISVLDAWIKNRNLSIKGTIDNFVDLLNIIAEIAEGMARYGQVNASKVLVRASEHFAATIRLKE